MDNIIVTVRSSDDSFQYDMEIPHDLSGHQATLDVIENVNTLRMAEMYSPIYHGLYVNRIKRFLQDDETLLDADVRNGDYITVQIRNQ